MPDVIEEDFSEGASENDYEDSELTKIEHDDDMAEGMNPEHADGNGSEIKKPKLDPKDPHRPRRKKARRACFACQRAHLTCGTFQPCPLSVQQTPHYPCLRLSYFLWML